MRGTPGEHREPSVQRRRAAVVATAGGLVSDSQEGPISTPGGQTHSQVPGPMGSVCVWGRDRPNQRQSMSVSAGNECLRVLPKQTPTAKALEWCPRWPGRKAFLRLPQPTSRGSFPTFPFIPRSSVSNYLLLPNTRGTFTLQLFHMLFSLHAPHLSHPPPPPGKLLLSLQNPATLCLEAFFISPGHLFLCSRPFVTLLNRGSCVLSGTLSYFASESPGPSGGPAGIKCSIN